MKLAVSTSKYETIKLQLMSLLSVRAENISTSGTCYPGIALLKLENTAVSTDNSRRNIEALLLDEAAASELQHPTATEGRHCLNR